MTVIESTELWVTYPAHGVRVVVLATPRQLSRLVDATGLDYSLLSWVTGGRDGTRADVNAAVLWMLA